MFESLRIFGLLLHKSWLVRKRHWKTTVFAEILGPLFFVYLIVSMSSLNTELGEEPPEVSKTDLYYEKQSLDELLFFLPGALPTFYVPKNKFTDKLMAKVKDCFSHIIYTWGFATESEFDKFYRKNIKYRGYPHVVIFDKSIDQSTKHLNYKLRYRVYNPLEFPLSLYNSVSSLQRYSKLYHYYMFHNCIVQMQICLDRSFINMKSGNKPIPKIYIQRMPYPAHTIAVPFYNMFRVPVRAFVMVAYTFPYFIESVRASKEKFSGVNVLMSINGISNTLNLLSWIISAVLFLGMSLVFLIVYMLTHSGGSRLPFFHYGNSLLFYFVLILYLAHLLAYGMHISVYFLKAWHVVVVLFLLNHVSNILQQYVFSGDRLYLAPYFGIVFPHLLFFQAMDQIDTYETRAQGIHWYNLFTNADSTDKIDGSLGVILILTIIGIIFHFLLAIYVYAVRPGKYGVAKHPLYFLKRKSEANSDAVIESIKYDSTSDQYFEPTSKGVYFPGIQIRNLKKAYNVNIFSEEKVHALRGVSIDFYKGQITSLLGHNGAGKTTMISILTGMTSATEGTVLIDSKDLKENASEIMKDMGLCTQEDIYFPSLSVSEQLVFFAMVKNKDKTRPSSRQDVEALLQKLNMINTKELLPKTLSGGQKRRLCLAMALVGDTNTLILDEPTSGLDPESRRVIWNMLLEMRGEKTILISTHDMEEADILGDRIAIMHTGELKSYGTPLFLKRLLGQNNVEITLSIEPRSDPEKIRNELHKEGIIVKRDATKMVVKIPNSPTLPDTLDNLEKKKKELGVTGFSVALISLEQIFLKITQENDDPPNPHQGVDNEETKLTGYSLYMQTVRALWSKKLTYARKNYSTILIQILTIFIALLLLSNNLLLLSLMLDYKEESRNIKLNMYHKPNALYTSDDKNLGDQYKNISRNFGGNPIEVTDDNLESALLKRAKENLVLYNNYLIAAAELDKSSATAFYSEMASFSLPISVNLLGNTILQNLMGPDYSISISGQHLPLRIVSEFNWSDWFAGAVSPSFVLVLCTTIGMFVVHPHREAVSGVKQLQKMTGVSGLAYWGTMFLVDLIQIAFLAVLVVIGAVLLDLSYELRMFGPKEVFAETLLLVLFGISTLPLLYNLSFLKKKIGTVLMWAMLSPVVLVLLDTFLSAFRIRIKDSETNILRPIQKTMFLMLPWFSYFQSQISFFRTAEINARCRRLPNEFFETTCMFNKTADVCCGLDCHDGRCEKSRSFFADRDQDVSMSTSVTYLCATPILYLVILALLESRFFEKNCKSGYMYKIEPSSDEQVQQEKAMIYERIQTLRGNKPSSVNAGTSANEQVQLTDNSSNSRIFLVYELQKSYLEVRAVQDLSFGVDRRECFVLLGVNGAGKSTAFRMMTGGEIPDYGIMYLGDMDFERKEKYFLSQMGYCPQNDIFLESLNSYENLKLFARLRGIPEKHVENEVQAWIDRLNLTAYASQPSGTYSGGNKRRLNVAIALIGNPNLILMDEPTTGVDPGAKRSLWNVIKACQMAGQSVVLTSHSMVECEALCDRLAIMVGGKLVCIGASEQLKQRFGAGYDIKIGMNPEKARDQMDDIISDVTQLLNCILIDANLSHLMFHVAPAGTTWRKMYDVMNQMKNKYDCIDDFLVLSSTLEQLFLLFAKTASSRSNS